MGKKKEKITYVDDGRTIADMSGVTGGRSYLSQQAACDILEAYFYGSDVDDIKKSPWKF